MEYIFSEDERKYSIKGIAPLWKSSDRIYNMNGII